MFFLSHFSTGSTLSFVLGGNPMITQQGSMQSTLHSYWENGWAHSKTNGRNVDLNCKEMGRRKPPCRMFKVLNIVGQSQFVCLLTWYWIARIILEPPFWIDFKSGFEHGNILLHTDQKLPGWWFFLFIECGMQPSNFETLRPNNSKMLKSWRHHLSLYYDLVICDLTYLGVLYQSTSPHARWSPILELFSNAPKGAPFGKKTWQWLAMRTPNSWWG